jgi:uncharacterized damage-inducible protein DinB
MKPAKSELTKSFLEESRHSIAVYHLPRLIQCLTMLSEKDIWWRPNAASNSVGNLVLHISGNVRQWIISGLGEEQDIRDRDREFAERGPIRRRALLALIRGTVDEASNVLGRLSEDSLLRIHNIQGFRVSGMYAVVQVVHHFAYHTGQIIFATKWKLGKDLKFTRLPAYRPELKVTFPNGSKR